MRIHLVPYALLAAVLAPLDALCGTPKPYAASAASVNVEGYRHAKVLSIPWGREKGQVGQVRLNSRGALSYSPRYLSVSPRGDLYVGDEVNQRILRFERNGRLISSFGAAYGGYHMFVDAEENVYAMFRRPFQPFTIAVYRDGEVIREIGLGHLKRNPAGDRIWVDFRGGLHLNLVSQYMPIGNLTEPVEKPMTMENLITGEKWEYVAACQQSGFGGVRQGCPSRRFDRVYGFADADLVVTNMKGQETGRFSVRGPVTEKLGLEKGASLDVPNAVRVFGDDPAGNVYLVVRNRVKAPGKSAFSIAKFSLDGAVLLAADLHPNGIHYGSEVQFYPSSLAVDRHENVYQLCTEGETGVMIVKWSKPGQGDE